MLLNKNVLMFITDTKRETKIQLNKNYDKYKLTQKVLYV